MGNGVGNVRFVGVGEDVGVGDGGTLVKSGIAVTVLASKLLTKISSFSKS